MRGRRAGWNGSDSAARLRRGPADDRMLRSRSMHERNADERPVFEGGGGVSARPMRSVDVAGFIGNHGLWTEAQYAALGQMRRVVDELGIELVRFAFVDQHGIVRSKTIARGALTGALKNGVTAPSSLLLKDTSGQSVFAVFSS